MSLATQRNPEATQTMVPKQAGKQGLLSIAGSYGIVRRAAVLALVIGSVLTLLNQQEALFGDAPLALAPFILVYLTPFVVVVLSQVFGTRTLFLEVANGRPKGLNKESFAATALSHGIPLRVVTVALGVGTAMTPVIAGLTLLDGGDLSRVPLAQIGQVYALPLIFGLLSQTLAYRRARARVRARRENR